MVERERDQQGDGYETGGDPRHGADTGSNDRDADQDIERAGDRTRAIDGQEDRARTGAAGGYGSSGSRESGGTSDADNADDSGAGPAGEATDGTDASSGQDLITE